MISFLIVAGIVVLTVRETKNVDFGNEGETVSPLSGEKDALMIISDDETVVQIYTESIRSESGQYEEIEALIVRYFDAVSQCSVDVLNSIVENSGGLSEEKLQQKAEQIESYQNIECTVREGLAEDTYIVYVSYEAQFREILTPLPNLERFYVKQNSDGAVYLYEGEVDGESAAYMQELEKSEEIVRLIEQVRESALWACRQEKALQQKEEIVQINIWE